MLPGLDDVGGLASGWEIDGDGPSLAEAAGPLDQPQGFVFADEFGVAEGVDQDLRVHGPTQRPGSSKHSSPAGAAVLAPTGDRQHCRADETRDPQHGVAIEHVTYRHARGTGPGESSGDPPALQGQFADLDVLVR